MFTHLKSDHCPEWRQCMSTLLTLYLFAVIFKSPLSETNVITVPLCSLSSYIVKVWNTVAKLVGNAFKLLVPSLTCCYLLLFHCWLCDLVFLRENNMISRLQPLAWTGLLEAWRYLMPDCSVFVSAPVYQLCAPDYVLFCVCPFVDIVPSEPPSLQFVACKFIRFLKNSQGVCRTL